MPHNPAAPPRPAAPRIIRRQVLQGLAMLTVMAALGPCPAAAEPVPYRFDNDASVVAFTYDLQGELQRGRMPVKSAQVTLDLDNLPASRVRVVLDPTQARAGFFLATQAMRGPRILDAARHPEIVFRATRIRGDTSAARITGALTMRGVTREVTLDAALYRRADSDPAQRRNLAIRLTGSLSRSAFGADGYADLVGDRIGLRILARIAR